VEVEAPAWGAAGDLVAAVSSGTCRAVELAVDNGRLTLAVNSPDSGSATEESTVGYESDPLEIGFNARYLLDITSQLQSDDARFLFSEPGAPTLIRDPEDSAALYVLMPMRV